MNAIEPVKIVGIKLTDDELLMVGQLGCARRNNALVNHTKREALRTDPGYDNDVIGLAAELALARWLRVYFVPVIGQSDKTLGDVIGKFQVKATPYIQGHLIVGPDDKDKFPYVLGVVRLPWVKLVGWCWGDVAKKIGELKSEHEGKELPRTAYWVKQENLQPMGTLPGY